MISFHFQTFNAFSDVTFKWHPSNQNLRKNPKLWNFFVIKNICIILCKYIFDTDEYKLVENTSWPIWQRFPSAYMAMYRCAPICIKDYILLNVSKDIPEISRIRDIICLKIINHLSFQRDSFVISRKMMCIRLTLSRYPSYQWTVI